MAMDIDLNAISADAKPLASFLQEVLDRTLNVYESYSMPIPERRYWTLGEPAVDCEQLVVNFVQMYLGYPGDEATEPRRCQDPRSATVHIRVSRKVPTVGAGGKAPSAEAIQEHSQLIAYDAWCLMESASALDAWQESYPGLGVISTVEVEAPEGGYQTTVMTLTAAVP
jgi:hypothetical protein